MRHPKATHNPNTVEFWNKALEQKDVQELNYADVNRWNRLLQYYRGGTFLDVGCLNSPLGRMAKEKSPSSDVYALDFADTIIEYFQKIVPEVKYVCADCLKTPFENEFFDYIAAGEIIEHLDEPEGFIAEMFRILKPGGILALTTPWEEYGRHCGGELHVNFFSIDELKGIMSGFSQTAGNIFYLGDYKFIIIHAKK